MDLIREAPYRRIVEGSIGIASALDLLAVGLAREAGDTHANELGARKLFERYKMVGLHNLSKADLAETAGLEDFEATRALAWLELGRRSAGVKDAEEPKRVDSPQFARSLFAELGGQTQEQFWAAFLNTKNQLLAKRMIHQGTLNASIVGAREVFREAVRENAASVIVAHNHPSGDPEPSPEDLAVTRKLAEVGEMLDIRVLDHVIIGKNKSVSLKERGVL